MFGFFIQDCFLQDNGQNTDEASNTKVDPLNSLERLSVSTNVLEDDLSGEDGSNDGADSLDGLRQLKTELGVLGRTADGNVWVGGGLESRQTRTSKEHGTAETTEASLDSRRPEHESTDTVDGETENEGVSVTEAAKEPSGVSQWSNKVRAEVCSLQTRRLSTSDVESDLEARVENIEKTVGESPHEEEDGDQSDGNDGLAGGKTRSTGNDTVVDRLAANLLVYNFSN
jgi:vacuolar-type H+-ATPase subunit I/STV1